MKKVLSLLLVSMFVLGACGSATGVEPTMTEESEKRTEMLSSGVSLYLQQMTSKYSSAFTMAFTKEDKMKYLNEAITDINLAVQEIEDEYEEGTPPTDELFKLADLLLDTIDYEMTGGSVGSDDSAYNAGLIIGDLSREYLDGELPIGIKLMTGKENAND